jgi:hypothetical protein
MIIAVANIGLGYALATYLGYGPPSLSAAWDAWLFDPAAIGAGDVGRHGPVDVAVAGTEQAPAPPDRVGEPAEPPDPATAQPAEPGPAAASEAGAPTPSEAVTPALSEPVSVVAPGVTPEAVTQRLDGSLETSLKPETAQTSAVALS